MSANQLVEPAAGVKSVGASLRLGCGGMALGTARRALRNDGTPGGGFFTGAADRKAMRGQSP
jgi:hypothetical protein